MCITTPLLAYNEVVMEAHADELYWDVKASHVVMSNQLVHAV